MTSTADRTARCVLDASVTAGWLLPDEHTADAMQAYRRVRSGAVELLAPDLWLWECGNVIANAVKRGRLAAADAGSLWTVLDRLRNQVELTALEPAQVQDCLHLAVDEALSIYDAAYLWLAQALAAPLLTHDARLRAAATRRGVALLTMADL